MIGFQYYSGALADDNTRSHGITGGYARHDGSSRNTQVFNSIDLEIGINYRDGITSHLETIKNRVQRCWIRPAGLGNPR